MFILNTKFASRNRMMISAFIFEKKKNNEKIRGHPGLNQGPLDLQSNALPLSYIPMLSLNGVDSFNMQ